MSLFSFWRYWHVFGLRNCGLSANGIRFAHVSFVQASLVECRVVFQPIFFAKRMQFFESL